MKPKRYCKYCGELLTGNAKFVCKSEICRKAHYNAYHRNYYANNPHVQEYRKEHKRKNNDVRKAWRKRRYTNAELAEMQRTFVRRRLFRNSTNSQLISELQGLSQPTHLKRQVSRYNKIKDELNERFFKQAFEGDFEEWLEKQQPGIQLPLLAPLLIPKPKPPKPPKYCEYCGAILEGAKTVLCGSDACKKKHRAEYQLKYARKIREKRKQIK